MGMHNFRKLSIWVKSKDFVVAIYKATKAFPSDEKFGVTSQVRRAAMSVPLNISEGAGRRTNKDFVQFLHIAKGSLNEVETLLEICYEIEYLDEESKDKLLKKVVELKKMIFNFSRALEKV